MIKAYIHPTCSTCKQVLKWLDANQLAYETYNIKEVTPPTEQFEQWLDAGMKRTQILNTSGQKYRELGLKEQLATLSNGELAKMLNADGMLIKRPILWYNERVSFGSNEKLLNEVWQ